MKGDGLYQAPLDRGIDIERAGFGDRIVTCIQNRVNLAQRYALNGYRDFNEVAARGLEKGQAFESPDFPRRNRIRLPQLSYRERPRQVAELPFFLDVIRNIDLVELGEVVIHLNLLRKVQEKAPGVPGL